MSGDGGTYAPKSPDLSSFYSPGPTEEAPSAPAQPQTAGAQPQQLPSQQSQSQFSPHQRLHLQPPVTTYFPGAPTHSPQRFPQGQQQEQQQQRQQQIKPQPAPAYSPYFSSPSHTAPQTGPGFSSSSPVQSQQHSPQQHQKPSPFGTQYRPQFPVPPAQFYGTTPATSTPLPGQAHAVSSSPSFAAAQVAGGMPPKRGAAAQAAPAPAIEPSPVKTKFPTARIKRIMQADEEVGKVAQQTPIAVGKALEMFMVNLVTKSADVAREKNSKRVSAQMLKQVVESDDQWDFLRDIVSRVENEEKASTGGAGAGAAGKGRARAETESEEEVIPEKKKRVGRKKRAA
ncbi:hypothetical protein QBC34DRAFT_426316 [Podospora aff. communis PSN243]|uniref:NCT transcriptional regulatory complex subunit A n=1 Tax=Podospora aff. communis PSN243 TaxID=3040156 RepID=A0AAV9GPG1_9PEZI|nr:hypothetical protein QBC34DRAFT_426316 [Podospora aff. communis PSN243]